MLLFGARPPVEDRERQWIEKMLAWCVEQFGREALETEVLIPTPSFFPGMYRGTPEDVLGVVDLVRAHLRIDSSEIAVALYDGRPPAHSGSPARRDLSAESALPAPPDSAAPRGSAEPSGLAGPRSPASPN